LKLKGYLKQTSASVGKVYQPRVMQVNSKILVEELSLKEKIKQVHSIETSTSKSDGKLETLEVIILEIKFWIDQTIPISFIDTFSISIPTMITKQPIIFVL
jgi:hypothetical protein